MSPENKPIRFYPNPQLPLGGEGESCLGRQVCVFPLLAVQAECMDNTWAQRAVVETRQLRKKDPKCGELLYWYARALLRLGGCRQDVSWVQNGPKGL